MKLSKISDTHYVVVDDSEIKEGDFVLFNNQILQTDYFDSWFNKWEFKNYPISPVEYQKYDKPKKITHSTQPLEQRTNSYSHGFNMKSMSSDVELVFDKIKPLSLSEVEEAINGYSVEKMADEFSKKRNRGHCNDLYPNCDQTLYEVTYDEYKAGFNAHKELMKDKLLKLIEELNIKAKSFIPAHVATNYYKQIEILKSLLPKTEWECTIDEQGKLKLI